MDAQSTTTRGSSSFTSFRDKVQRALSPSSSSSSSANRSHSLLGERRTSFGRTMSHLEEGRAAPPLITSTGRGGAGNLVRSVSRDPDVLPGQERGRAVGPQGHLPEHITHSGRGGAGNIRSPSRDPAAREQEAREEALQDKLVHDARGRQAEAAFSTGRGGSGNISRSKSRSRSAVRDHRNASPAPPFAAHGRGGFGNIAEERHSVDSEKDLANKKYEAEIRAKHAAEDGTQPHLLGKGGYGNVAPPNLEHVDPATLNAEERAAHDKLHAQEVQEHHYVSSGRGGAGNVHRIDGDERGRDKHHGGVLGNIVRSLSKAAGRDKSADRA